MLCKLFPFTWPLLTARSFESGFSSWKLAEPRYGHRILIHEIQKNKLIPVLSIYQFSSKSHKTCMKLWNDCNKINVFCIIHKDIPLTYHIVHGTYIIYLLVLIITYGSRRFLRHIFIIKPPEISETLNLYIRDAVSHQVTRTYSNILQKQIYKNVPARVQNCNLKILNIISILNPLVYYNIKKWVANSKSSAQHIRVDWPIL
jgi:hypothetical protein